MTTINPRVVDISHYDSVTDFRETRAFGIVGVIHKSSEGPAVVDRRYATRRHGALNAGLLWGAYHFLRPGDMVAQAEHFVSAADPDSNTLISLDYEVPGIPYSRMRQFVELVEAKIGRKIVLYSGNTIKEQLGSKVDPWLGARRLWLAQYSRTWKVQPSWSKPWLWQYTGDGVGLPPHHVPGVTIEGGLDISSYDGSDDDLRAEWAQEPLVA